MVLDLRTIKPTSSAEPGSTEQADVWELEENACSLSDKYSGAAVYGPMCSALGTHSMIMMSDTCEGKRLATRLI